MSTELEDKDVLLLLRRHADLENQHDDGDAGNFPSGWQCENPWRYEIEQQVAKVRGELDPGRYFYADDNDVLRASLLALHHSRDGVTPSDIFIGDGSSSILLAFAAWLRTNGHSEIYYVPPLYFSFHYVLRLLGIRTRPISGRHGFESEFSMNLPAEKCVLILTDPIWYAGLPLRTDVMASLSAWQEQTQSLIFVDGSFQYMRWDSAPAEASARLTSEFTIRLLCPTKTLAMHGHRFSYAIIPSAIRREFARANTTLVGCSSIDSAAFGSVAAEALSDGRVPALLAKLASQRHARLRAQGRIAAAWQPQCGYFCFERVLSNWESTTPLMDGSYFEQKRFPDHRRINLLSPSLSLLDTNDH